MDKRKIIKIDEQKCTGCGLCIPNCPEGALQIIDGKARLVGDSFCDGLGACIGYCPQGAITIEERQGQEYDEKKVMENIVKQGENVIKAHLMHLKNHNQNLYLKEAIDFLKKKRIELPMEEILGEKHIYPSTGSVCPGLKIIDSGRKQASHIEGKEASGLRQWPVKILLVPAAASYLQDADLLIAADCVPFAYADFHQDLLKDKILLVGCPKLGDARLYTEKITQVLEINNIKSVTYVHMQVPCCFGLVSIIKSAISASGKSIPFEEIIISIKGEKLG
jgi:ferredoxin